MKPLVFIMCACFDSLQFLNSKSITYSEYINREREKEREKEKEKERREGD